MGFYNLKNKTSLLSYTHDTNSESMVTNQLKKTYIYWNGFTVGKKYNFGEYLLTSEAIINFGMAYDPLPHHISEETAKQSPIGKLCASGIQGLGIAHKILCDNLLTNSALVAGKGFEEMVVHTPILPDQKLHIEMEVLASTPHKYKTDRGWITYQVRLFNESAILLLSYRATVLFLADPEQR